MNESALPKGSGLSVSVDLTDDDPPNGAELSAPSAKKARLVYQQPSSSGSSATGRPHGTLWAFFTKSASKQNKSHYSAFCDACTQSTVQLCDNQECSATCGAPVSALLSWGGRCRGTSTGKRRTRHC